MRDTERAIGIIDLVDDHAKAKQVGNLQQLEFLAPHLLVDAVDILRAPDHAGADTLLAQRGRQRLFDFADQFARVAKLRLHRLHHDRIARSEEHTSELQSLMRISYAVSCFKKKIKNNNKQNK